jgi:hypothetical protein
MRYLLYIALVLTIYSCKGSYGQKLTYGKGELFYTDNVNKQQAEKLGGYLQNVGFWQADRTISVQLDKAADTFLFRMVVQPSYLNDPAFHQTAVTSVKEFSNNVFDKSPTVIHFCNDQFKTLKVIRGEM